MTKKTNAKALAVLDEIGSLICALSVTYPKQAARYRKASAEARRWDEYPVGHPCYLLAVKWQERAMREADIWREQCIRRQGDLSRLARLLGSHFPEFGGKRRAIRLHAADWHERPPEEWETLLDELLQVENDALQAAKDLMPTGKARGRPKLSLKEKAERVAIADVMGDAAYADMHGCSRDAIRGWRRDIKKTA